MNPIFPTAGLLFARSQTARPATGQTQEGKTSAPTSSADLKFAGEWKEIATIDHGKNLRAEMHRSLSIHLWASRPRKVTHIADGDTFVVKGGGKNGVKVRLFGVDALEHDQPHGEEAKQALIKLIEGKRVRLKVVAVDKLYNRLVAIPILGQGPFKRARSVNELMVEAGWAFASEQDGVFTETQRRFIDEHYEPLEAAAHQAKRGVWHYSDNPVRPWTKRHQAKQQG